MFLASPLKERRMLPERPTSMSSTSLCTMRFFSPMLSNQKRLSSLLK